MAHHGLSHVVALPPTSNGVFRPMFGVMSPIKEHRIFGVGVKVEGLFPELP